MGPEKQDGEGRKETAGDRRLGNIKNDQWFMKFLRRTVWGGRG